MTNREIIDLKPGRLIVTGKRIKLTKIWQVEELIENDQYALRTVSVIRLGDTDQYAGLRLLPRTPPGRVEVPVAALICEAVADLAELFDHQRYKKPADFGG